MIAGNRNKEPNVPKPDSDRAASDISSLSPQITQNRMVRFAKSALLAGVLTMLSFSWVAHAQSQYRQPERRAESGAWVVECFGPVASESCQIYQRVLMNQGRSVALVATFAFPQNSQRVDFQIAVPLGIELTRMANLQIGPDFNVKLPVTRCTQQGCLLEGAMSQNLLDRLSQSNAAFVSVQNPGVGPFQIPLSLNGFSEALRAIAPPAPPQPEEPVSDSGDPLAPTDANNQTSNTGLSPPTGNDNPGDNPGLVAPLPQTTDNRLSPVTGSEASN